jgi:hypothetical protein
MAIQVQLRRDTLANVLANHGAAGELFVSTDTHEVFVQDGATNGGFQIGGIRRVAASAYGITTATADCGPLIAKLPKYTEVWFAPGIYTFATYPTQEAFSNVFYRGNTTVWRCTGSLLPDFDLTKIAFNWVYAAPSFGGYPIGQSANDMTSAGLSPIEGIAIISALDGNSGVGLALGMPIAGDLEVRSTTSKAAGKVHVEFTSTVNNSVHSTSVGAGFSSVAHLLTGGYSGYTGSDTASLGYRSDGSVAFNATNILAANAGTQFGAGNVLALEIDFTAKLLWVKNITNGGNWNNSGTANPATGTGGLSVALTGSPWFVDVDLHGTPGDVITVNFGASTFALTPSAGFAAWDASGATTLNPADRANVLLSNGNLSAASVSIYPINYYLRPRNFSVGGFYVNIGFPIPTNCFLTGIENVVIKGGNIGVYYNNGAAGASNSGENLLFKDCNFNQLTADGFQILAAQKATFRGCSFTYNHRHGYASNQLTCFEGCYFEFNATSTPNEMLAADGGSTISFDDLTILLSLPLSTAAPAINLTGANASVLFNKTQFFSSTFQQLFYTGASFNIFGSLRGCNGTNFPTLLSQNQNFLPDGLFASGGILSYPGSSGVTVQTGTVHAPQTHAALLTGTATLITNKVPVKAGEWLFLTFFDQLTGTVGGLTGNCTFYTGDAIQIGSPTPLSYAGWNTTARGWTMQFFQLNVPAGTGYVVLTITVPSASGNYYLSELCLYQS